MRFVVYTSLPCYSHDDHTWTINTDIFLAVNYLCPVLIIILKIRTATFMALVKLYYTEVLIFYQGSWAWQNFIHSKFPVFHSLWESSKVGRRFCTTKLY
jgi:hypothetical protein